jgi:glutaminyl-peptide cyclotransferase
MSSSSCPDDNSTRSSSISGSETKKQQQQQRVHQNFKLVMFVTAAFGIILLLLTSSSHDGQHRHSNKSSTTTTSRMLAGGNVRWLSSWFSTLQTEMDKTAAAAAAASGATTRRTATRTLPITRQGSFQVLDKVPHDASAFTQGLQMVNETHYYESLGLYGESSVRLVELSTATTVLETKMGQQWFGEGLCQYTVPSPSSSNSTSTSTNRLIQITWQEQLAFIYDADTLQELQRIPYQTSNGEGWGITLNPSKQVLYVTDGSSNLHTWSIPIDRSAATAAALTSIHGQEEQQVTTEMREVSNRVVVKRTLRNGMSITVGNLNELEYDPYASDNSGDDDGGSLLANIWHSDVIVRINPETGHVTTIYDLTSLYPYSERPQSADVLNGIAAIPNHPQEFWVTGKKWPYMFRIRLTMSPSPDNDNDNDES